MSEMRPDIDLSTLARVEPSAPRPRRFHPLWLLPLVVGAAFLTVLWSTIEDALTDPVVVTLVRPRAAGAGAAEGAVVLQAAGWVEPDPFPSSVTALTPGVIREVLVQESEEVEAGQVVARLVEVDQALELARSEAAEAAAHARLQDARAERNIAEESFEAALEVTELVAVAESEAAAHAEEFARETAAVAAAGARLEVARAELETQRFLQQEQAAGPWQVELAAARLAEMDAAHRVARRQEARVREAMAATEARVHRARQERELRLDDRLRLARARAAVELHTALVAEAEQRTALARQSLEWCEVRTPVSGIVLERLAMPGSALGDGAERVVCSVYDPARLRVRVDVPQSDIALLDVEQEARVTSNARRDEPYHGKVLRIVHRADIQKVTLEVQVEILDEDALLRPEMLCQVRFLAVATGGEEEPGSERVLLVPQRLIDGGEAVWVLDASGDTARRRTVRLGARRGEEVEVIEGINLSDKLIDRGRSELEDGDRVTVRSEP